MSKLVFKEVTACLRKVELAGNARRVEAFDKVAFKKLCVEKEEIEGKQDWARLAKPDSLIPLPNDDELDSRWFGHTMWFSSLVEATGEDKILLHFNVVKRLEQYCLMVKQERDIEKEIERNIDASEKGNWGVGESESGDAENLTGAALLVVNFVVGKERDLHDVEEIGRYFEESEPNLWLAPVEREKFIEEGVKKFNVRFTFLVDLVPDDGLVHAICKLSTTPFASIEKIQVLDFYEFLLDEGSSEMATESSIFKTVK